MLNPATQLAAMLDDWSVPAGHQPVELRRALSRDQGRTLEDEHLRACDYLREISAWIERLSGRVDVGPYQRALPRWHASVFSFDTGWTNTAAQERRAINVTDRDLLIGLANLIDLAGATLGIAPASRATVDQAIEDAETFVKGAATIAESLRLHLLGLLAAIREAVDSGRSDRAVPLVTEFIGSVTLAAESVPEDEKQGWRDLAKEWAVAFTSGLAVQGAWPILLAGEELVRRITG